MKSMKTMESFLLYHVQRSPSFSWHLLSPTHVFDQVDHLFWNDLNNRFSEQSPYKLNVIEASFSLTQWPMIRRACPEPITVTSERQVFWETIPPPVQSSSIHHKHLQGFAGKQLLWSEIQEHMQHLTTRPMQDLQILYLQGLFDWDSAVGQDHGCFCQRCGNRSSQLFNQQPLLPASCTHIDHQDDETCTYCPRCLSLGKVRSCQPFLKWSSFMSTHTHLPFDTTMFDPTMKMEQQLSSEQQQASLKLERFVRHSQQEKKEYLLWAVCGAGKTEILFDCLHSALRQGDQVVFCSPRRDVILELAPRLQAVFPNLPLCILHGDSDDKFVASPLVLATTHQLLRYTHHFDLIVLDEEDAFPFHNDPMLPYALHKARRAAGKTIYVSATPNKHLLKQVGNKTMPYIQISRRYHGYPLAVPQLEMVGRWRKHMESGQIASYLLDFVRHLLLNKRCGYIFVPRIDDLERVYVYLFERIKEYMLRHFIEAGRTDLYELERQDEAIKQFFNEKNECIQYVHATSEDRTNIVQRFREGRIRLLLTTTILERGVTIGNSDVAILGSDDPLFDQAALIQMAGRVGRKLEDPIGQVWFWAEHRTRQQNKAIEQIEEWNRRRSG